MQTIQFDNAEFLPHVCELTEEGHTVSIRAKGNSMRPFVESDRDVAVLCHADSYKVGDVVLAEIAKGHYVLHRIDAIKGDKVRLRGDGNPYQVEYCTLKDIRALTCQFVRKGKTYNLDGWVWKVYSWFWVRLLPVRKYLLAFYRWFWMGEMPGKVKRLLHK